MSQTSNSNINNDVNQELKKLRQQVQTIVAKSLSLEMEVEEIKSMNQSVSNSSRWLVEKRVWFYRHLGEALYEHREHVFSAGYAWQEWATEKFPFIKSTRRDQCIKLATFGVSLEKFYFLGIDLLYPFANLMSDLKLNGEKEIGQVADYFDLNAGANIEHVDQCEYKIKIEKFFEYFKFKKNMNGSYYDQKMVLAVIESGVVFNSHDSKAIQELSTNPSKQNEYLFQMLVNVGSPKKGPKQSANHQDSMLAVIANFIALADKHIASGKFPSYLTKSNMRPFLKKTDQYYSSLPK
jgi:FtsZ-binding cell division protein ZapB